MTQEVDCFWLEPSGQVRICLRRYSRGRSCPAGRDYCNAQLPLTIVPEDDEQENGDLWPHDDPRWPQLCAECGHPFREHDHYQLRHVALFVDNRGAVMTLEEAPPGAMWNADWYADAREPGPDGNFLTVRLPCGGDWFVDGAARGQPFHVKSWTREGDVPNVTVNPSVKSGGWRGFLVDGKLKGHFEGEEETEDEEEP